MWRLFLAAVAVLVLHGCVAINGVSNSSLVRPLLPEPTFRLFSAEGTGAVDRKVGQMIAYQLLKRGFQNTKGEPQQLNVIFATDVAPAGVKTTAFTTINQPKQRYTVVGNNVVRKSGTATATTVVDSTQNFKKSISVWIEDAATGDIYWEGEVSEVGWCRQIFVTAPNILALMFEGFPDEATNRNKRVDDRDPVVQELRSLFPPDTNWGCRAT